MIRVSVMYKNVQGATFDHDYYRTKHMALVREKFTPFGLVRVEIDQGIVDGGGGPAPMVAIGYMVFESMEALQKAMASPALAELEADIPNFTNIEPVIQVSQLIE
jgi:uncharacterized protein (TIGR02118 family)